MEGFDYRSEVSDVGEQVAPRLIPSSPQTRLSNQTVSSIRGPVVNNASMQVNHDDRIQSDPELKGLSVGQQESVSGEFPSQSIQPTPASASTQPGSINVRSRHSISIQAINAISGN